MASVDHAETVVPSLRSTLLRRSVRPALGSLELLARGEALSLRSTRAVLSLTPHLGVRHPDVTHQAIDVPTPEGRVVGEWNRPPSARRGAILYVHGSAYVGCSVRTHRPLVSQIAAAAGVPVFSVEYRLAPRHVFPAAADDVRRAYDHLLADGYRADEIVLAGDSAGGHLVVDLALDLLRTDQPMPAGLALLSPLVDPTLRLAEARERVRRDPMLSARGARRLIARYVADADPLHARLTHVVAAHETLPPTLIQAGGAEMLAADAHHLHDMLLASGTASRLEMWPGQMHVFQAMGRLVPEAQQAIDRIGDFVGDVLDAGVADTSRLGAAS